MDRDTAEGLTWVIFYSAPVVAGAVAMAPALKCEKPGAALKRGLSITWILGVLLAFLAGWGLDFHDPGPLSREFETAVVQLPVSFLAGVLVGGLCALRVWARSAGQESTAVETAKPAAAGIGVRIVTLLFWLVMSGVVLLLGARAVEDGLKTGRWWQIGVVFIACVILAAGLWQCLRTLRSGTAGHESS